MIGGSEFIRPQTGFEISRRDSSSSPFFSTDAGGYCIWDQQQQGYFRDLNSAVCMPPGNEIPVRFLRSSEPPPYMPKASNFISKEENQQEETCKKEPPLKKRPRAAVLQVRKERLGDRVNALQQLVSPFGKTDTASVLHEAIEYIKYLHDQLDVLLSSPYFKNKSHHHKQEGCLMSRGLCLTPISVKDFI
ncbi:hypothetical protein M569_07030 [Genlisea aurea]|uniref:BHLH domain-containing protein n=1 Tax=Genlisea aurea TaxID=192259 RepID=S8CKM4_9LAMI|nr:hypothetical protein M569_07030 [Genlisea aurea]